MTEHPYAEGSEWNLVREHIAKKASELMDEKKTNAKTGFANINFRKINGKRYYFAKSNAFHVIETDFWERAIERSPQRFGTGNAYDVLDAFEDLQPLFPTLSRFRDFLIDDTCCYIVEVSSNGVTPRTLRVDLFRQIDPSKTGDGDEFTGGLFHANRHFSLNEQPLSTRQNGYQIRSISDQLTIICEIFFQGNMSRIAKNKYTAVGPFDADHELIMSLFHDDSKNLEIFFINTLHVQRKSKNN